MESSVDLIRHVTALLAPVVRDGVAKFDDRLLCTLTAELEALGRLVDTARAQSAAEIDDRSRFELGSDGFSMRLGGHRRSVHFLEQLTRTSQAEAQRRIALGRSIRSTISLSGEVLPAPYPTLAEALIAGTIGTDAAASITRNLDIARRNNAEPELLNEAERALVEAATVHSADLVRTQATVWRAALDPDGVEPREESVRARRGARLSREYNGLSTLTVTCDHELAATLRSAFGKANAPGSEPVFLSEDERARGTRYEDGLTVFLEPRSREQIQHDVLLGLLNAGLRSNGELKPLTSVVATVRLDDLLRESGVAWVDGVNEPVSIETISQFVCDSGFRKLVLGVDDDPLFLGKTERLFSPAQRKARAAIDGGCVWTQCNAPPSWCQMHHVKEVVADDGPTDINNGVLLCSAHHHMLHHSEFRMKMVKSRAYLLAPPHLDPSQTWVPLGRSRLMMTGELERRRA